MDLNYKRLFHQLLLALSRALDFDAAQKLDHGLRAAVLSQLLAVHLCPSEQVNVYYAALLHDIGGIGLFNHIVHHPSPEAQASNMAIRVHPVVGAQIIDNIPGMEQCVPIVLNHHERYDCHGYPSGKKPEDIPLESQIIRAADSFDLFLHHARGIGAQEISVLFSQKSGKEISPVIADVVRQIINNYDNFLLLMDGEAVYEKCLELTCSLAGFNLPEGVDVIGSLLDVFAQVIDAKHAYTAGHSQRVAKYSVHIGLALDMSHDEITMLKWAALIHDLGKIAVPRSILDGVGAITEEDFEVIKRHPNSTIEVLSCVTELKDLAHFGAYHHERWDGKGYPKGLKGEEIPIYSRIICIADSFDSLTSNRSYHNAVGSKRALERLEKEAGAQFDSNIFKVAKTVLWSGID